MAVEKEFTGFLPSGAVFWIYLRGTIQEVLNSLSSHNVKAGNVIWWTDDGVNAEVVFCRRK